MNGAIELAGELLASRGGEHNIVVFTDRTSAPKPPEVKAPLSFVMVGTARDNLAITRFATRPLLRVLWTVA